MLRNSSTYLYMALFMGLLCYLTFIDKKIPGTKEQEEAENQLFNLNEDEVTGLEITNVHGQFIFLKNNNHWEIKKPVDTPADSSTLDGIIAQIAHAQPQRTIKVEGSESDMANLKEWGLTPPAERVVVHTKDKQYELLLGRKTAISDSVYARASGKKDASVRVIPNSVKEALQKNLSDFRSRDVFNFDVDKVTKVSTRMADSTSALGQPCEIALKDGKWTLQMPLVARASDADVQALLNKILGTRAVDFVTDDASNLSAYGLTSPNAILSVTVGPNPTAPQEEIVLQIGGPVPDKPDQVYAQRLKSNSVFTLAKSSVDDLLKAVPNVRDRRIIPFDAGKVTGLIYSFGTKEAHVRNDHGLWNTVGASEGRADVGKVTDLLARLSQLDTTPAIKDSATDLKPFGLDKPEGKITLQSPEFKPDSTVTLLIGKDVNKLLYVRNSTELFIYTIPENALDFLSTNNLELRDARAINLELQKVKGMTITPGPGPSVTLTRSSGGTWSTANVKDRMVDSTKADTQASLFCQLQAKNWLGPVLPAYGLSKPVLTIAVQTDKPDQTVLRIGAPLPDSGHAAQVVGESTAFEITDGDYGRLNASSLQLIPSVISDTNVPPAVPAPPATNAASTTPAKK